MNTNYWNDCYRERQNSISKDYDGWLSVYETQLQPGSRVLDLGCGAGTDVEALLKRDVLLTVSDLSPEAVRMVKQAFGEHLEADCFDMRDGFPYADASFDAVVSDLSLHYFTWAETERIVAGIGRILVPGGAIIARLHSIQNMEENEGEMIEENYYIAYGYPRRYFTVQDIRQLFADWRICTLKENVANRYGREKKVIEFVARKL
ncbi:MAG: class I SAM-dependent methyltransferase [Clostridia bacterium]|nr:class I SAM-dependent methyltransferase [Clostridia bacterium]